MKVRRGVATAWISAQVAVLAVAACTSAPAPNPDTTAPSTSDVTTAPMLAPPALFYSKAGSLYISDPAGAQKRWRETWAEMQEGDSPRYYEYFKIMKF